MPEPTEMQNVKSQIYYLTQTVLQLRGALKNTDVAVSSSSTTNDVPSLPSPVLTTTTLTIVTLWEFSFFILIWIQKCKQY